jgi:hypothetical protein
MRQFRQAKRLRQTERIAAPLQRLITRVFLLPWRTFIANLARVIQRSETSDEGSREEP